MRKEKDRWKRGGPWRDAPLPRPPVPCVMQTEEAGVMAEEDGISAHGFEQLAGIGRVESQARGSGGRRRMTKLLQLIA